MPALPFRKDSVVLDLIPSDAFVSVKSLIDLTGFDGRMIRTSLQKFERRGWVEMRRRRHKKQKIGHVVQQTWILTVRRQAPG